MAANGTPIRASHAKAGPSAAYSTNIWQTNESITKTPACACPARKKLICSGEGFTRVIFPLNSFSKK
jgi:hypothetical protein